MVRRLDRSLSEREALERALDDLQIEIAPLTSLLVLTEDAGSATAEAFYAEALAIGPALASPAAFPWCLANAACASIALRFGLIGPNVTWLVESLDAPAAYEPVVSWLHGADQPAVIVAIRFSDPSPRIAAWRWRAPGPVSAAALSGGWRRAAPAGTSATPCAMRDVTT